MCGAVFFPSPLQPVTVLMSGGIEDTRTKPSSVARSTEGFVGFPLMALKTCAFLSVYYVKDNCVLTFFPINASK